MLGVSHAHAAVPLNPNLSAEDYAFATTDLGVAAIAAEQGLAAAEPLTGVTAPVLPFTPRAMPPAGPALPAATHPEPAPFPRPTSRDHLGRGGRRVHSRPNRAFDVQ